MRSKQQDPQSLRGAAVLSRLEVLSKRLARESATTVGIVLVAWDAERTQVALDDVSAWLRQDATRRHAALVLNRDIDVFPSSTWVVVAGSNLAGEFSGYDEGMAALAGRGVETWILMNDRYAAYDGSPISTFDAALLSLVRDYPILIGQRDRLERRIYKEGPAQPDYIRTHYVMASDSLLSCVTPLAAHTFVDAEALLPQGWPLIDLPAGEPPELLDRGYLDFLKQWLTGRESKLSSHWYRATTDESRLLELRCKAVSIVNEHIFSQRAASLGWLVLDRRAAERAVGMNRNPALMRRQVKRWREFQPTLDARGHRIQNLLRVLLCGVLHPLRRA